VHLLEMASVMAHKSLAFYLFGRQTGNPYHVAAYVCRTQDGVPFDSAVSELLSKNSGNSRKQEIQSLPSRPGL
jgi:hypothetical protein